MVAVTNEEIFWAGRDDLGAVAAAVVLCAWTEVERLLKRLVALTKDLLADVREVTDLPERTGNMRLSTGDEDASCDNSLEWLAAKELLLVGTLVQLLRDIRDGLWEGELVAPG